MLQGRLLLWEDHGQVRQVLERWLLLWEDHGQVRQVLQGRLLLHENHGQVWQVLQGQHSCAATECDKCCKDGSCCTKKAAKCGKCCKDGTCAAGKCKAKDAATVRQPKTVKIIINGSKGCPLCIGCKSCRDCVAQVVKICWKDLKYGVVETAREHVYGKRLTAPNLPATR